MNAPATGADALPNAETMLEEIEKKQRELHGRRFLPLSLSEWLHRRRIVESKHKSGSTTTPLLEFLKRKREDRKQVGLQSLHRVFSVHSFQEKIIRIQQRRSHKQQTRNHPTNDDARPSTARVLTSRFVSFPAIHLFF